MKKLMTGLLLASCLSLAACGDTYDADTEYIGDRCGLVSLEEPRCHPGDDCIAPVLGICERNERTGAVVFH